MYIYPLYRPSIVLAMVVAGVWASSPECGSIKTAGITAEYYWPVRGETRAGFLKEAINMNGKYELEI